ncbi:MAG: methyltransferase domain-containing protein [Planctomycetes bacterium]|nr:methyltransferase domain-containing protein [Planctomycetota bacterium]MBI3411341.1 methyltransferase domain-containing protein [Planctomycetota bacterium]
MLPLWRLPPGVSRGLWDTLNDPAVAGAYDANLADTPLLSLDIPFVLEHCRPPGRIVDLGCGTGRLALALAKCGYTPVAIDLSAEMLKVLGDKAVARQLQIPRLRANLVDLGCLADSSFDHAACLFSTLGLIEGEANRRRFLDHVARLLKPGGTFVVHVHNRWSLLGTRHGRRLLAKNLVGSWLGNEARGDFVMPPNQGLGTMAMHLFTQREIERSLKGAGMSIVELRPIGLRPDGRLRMAWCFGRLRAYGYLIAARKR